MVAEHGREEHVTEGVLGIVVAHGDLLEHHVAFEFDVMGLATTPQHHIGNQVDGEFQIVVEHMRVVAGVLLGGERVQLTADRVDGLRDLHRSARRVALNSRCSRKCAAPATVGPSSREPTLTQTPTDADRTDGTYSVTTRRPPGRTVRRIAETSRAGAPLRRPRCRFTGT